MKKKHKSKVENSLLSLVLVDDYLVEKKLSRILSCIEGNWKVLNCKNFLSFTESKVSVTDEYFPKQKVTNKEISKFARISKEIYIAFVPDERGDYLSYKAYSYICKIKISVPIYRMRLPSITEDFVLNSFLKTKKIDYHPTKKYRYEARLALDRLVKFNLNEKFNSYLPFPVDLELHSAIVLNFINTISSKLKVAEIDGRRCCVEYQKNENTIFRSVEVDSKKLCNIESYEIFMCKIARYLKWVGSVKGLYEAYSCGYITWPTSSSSTRINKLNSDLFPDNKTGSSNWGMYLVNAVDGSISDYARDLISEVAYQNNFSAMYKNKFSIVTDDKKLFIPVYLYCEKLEEKNIVTLSKSDSLGCSQTSLAFYLSYLGIPAKIWAYTIFSLLKSNYIVNTMDTSYVITTKGKFVLNLIKQYIPKLTNEKFIIKTNNGIKKDINNDSEYYEFVSDRWDRINIELSEIEEVKFPKIISRCEKCSQRLYLNITDKGVFADCRNSKCSNKELMPLKFSKNKLEVIDE